MAKSLSSLTARAILLVVMQSSFMSAAFADRSASEAALADVLFELDMENVSYSIRHDGFIDISFGAAVTDEEFLKTVKMLTGHPDIPGILSGRGSGNYCPIP
jgi:hypothetical protein